MSQEAKISQLRTLLSATPDKASWEAIWTEVESWSKYQNHAVALDYLSQHIDRWPDQLRLLPHKCNDDWLQGAAHPMFPFVRGLDAPPLHTYTEPGDRWRGLLSPHAAVLTHVTFWGYSRDFALFVQALQQSPARLRSLTWCHSDIIEQGHLKTLCTLEALQSLKHLALQNNGITGEDWHIILEHAPSGLEQLDVSHNQLYASDVYQLFASERFGGLRRLGLAGNRIARQRLCPQVSALQRLEQLDLSHNGVAGRSLQQLSEAGALQALTTLDLSDTPLTPKDVQRVASSLPPGLKRLLLRCSDLGDEGLLQLAHYLPAEHQIDVIDVSGNHLSRQIYQQVAAVPSLAHTELRSDSPLFSREHNMTLRIAAHLQEDAATRFASDAYGISLKHDTVALARSTGSTASETVARVLAGEFDAVPPREPEALPPFLEDTPGTIQMSRWIGQFGRHMTQPESRLRCLAQKLHATFFVEGHNPRGHSRPMNRLSATFAAAAFYHGHILTAHEGKVRIYRWRRGRLAPITEDHSLLQEMRRQGSTTEEIENHPYRNVVLKVLGLEEMFDTEFQYHTIEEGDVYLFCTADVHENLSDDTMEEILDQTVALEQSRSDHRDDLEQACRRIVADAAQHSDRSNCVALLVHCCDGASPPANNAGM